MSEHTATKFTIAAMLDGFPVTVEVTGRREQLIGAIKALQDAGATPPANGAITTANDTNGAKNIAGGQTRRIGDDGVEVDGDGTPKCWVHRGRKMKSSNYGGWFCTGGSGDDRCKCKVKD